MGGPPASRAARATAGYRPQCRRPSGGSRTGNRAMLPGVRTGVDPLQRTNSRPANPSLRSVVERLAASARTVAGRAALVAISGTDGSGKTTVAAELARG